MDSDKHKRRDRAGCATLRLQTADKWVRDICELRQSYAIFYALMGLFHMPDGDAGDCNNYYCWEEYDQRGNE